MTYREYEDNIYECRVTNEDNYFGHMRQREHLSARNEMEWNGRVCARECHAKNEDNYGNASGESARSATPCQYQFFRT